MIIDNVNDKEKRKGTKRFFSLSSPTTKQNPYFRLIANGLQFEKPSNAQRPR